MSTIRYLLTSSACLSLFYLAYLLISKNETNFKQLRIYLLGAILLSVILPFNSSELSLNLFQKRNLVEIEQIGVQKPTQSVIGIPYYGESSSMDFGKIITIIYLIISIGFVIRILVQIFVLIRCYSKFDKIRNSGIVVIFNNHFDHPLSFFNWVFLPQNSNTNEEIEYFISHEKIHASQYHSIDLIIIELLAAVMWFNPLVWKMKNSILLLHEYLADEGAIDTGIDKLKYQALLINQITEERLICLSSNFNHSSIKKRMIMITKRKTIQGTKAKALVLLPLVAAMFCTISCNNSIIRENESLNHFEKKIALNNIEAETPILIKKQQSTEKLTLNFIEHKNRTDIEIKTSTGSVKYFGENKKPKILYIVDGKKSDSEMAILNIDENKVDEMGVGLKNRDDEKRIKQEGYDEVIWVTTKKI